LAFVLALLEFIAVIATVAALVRWQYYYKRHKAVIYGRGIAENRENIGQVRGEGDWEEEHAYGALGVDCRFDRCGGSRCTCVGKMSLVRILYL